MEPHLKLKEIIWEITGRCENHCSYCGSKDMWGEGINFEVIKSIALKISDYLWEGEINISGGDPLLIPLEIHEEVVRTLRNSNNKVKILINPKSLKDGKDGKDGKDEIRSLNVLKLYDLIGVSINTEEELDMFLKFDIPKEKCVIITNFNLTNIFLYDEIETHVKNKNLSWQIQYTMYKGINSNALYTNEPAKKHFFKCIQNSIENGTKIILADNLNKGKCSAGLQSLGILSNGYVVPCLSMRSWKDPIDLVDNILNGDLGYIWENGFKEYRFCEFKCCKDVCNSPFEQQQKENSFNLENYKKIFEKPIFPTINKPWKEGNMLYGVSQWDAVMAYAVYGL